MTRERPSNEVQPMRITRLNSLACDCFPTNATNLHGDQAKVFVYSKMSVMFITNSSGADTNGTASGLRKSECVDWKF